METIANFGQYLKGVNAKFAKVYSESLEKYSPYIMGESANIFKVDSNETDYRSVESQKSGVPYLPKQAVDGESAPLVQRYPGANVEWIQEMYHQGIAVTYLQMKFEEYKSDLNRFGDLVVAGKKTQDKTGFDMLINAATNGLLDSTHAYIPGSKMFGNTWSNIVTINSLQAELGVEALRLGKKQLSNRMLSDGTFSTSPVTNLALVVGPELADYAVTLTGSDKKPFTANNDINVYKGVIDVVVSPYLSSANGGDDEMWFLIDRDSADLRIKISEDIKKWEYTDWQTQTQYYYVDTILAAKPAHSFGVVGVMDPGAALF